MVFDAVAGQREHLRAVRARLIARQAEQLAETARLEGSRDLPALQAHAEKLSIYHKELDLFLSVLEAFHDRYGAIGESTATAEQRSVGTANDER